MAATYYSILTNNGKALIANATVNTKVGLSDIAVGDGNGAVPTPSETRTTLVNEKARFACNRIAINANNSNWIEAEIIIPSTSGGYSIRELGLYAGTTLVAIANFPVTYKPLETEGGAREIAIKMVINVQNAEVISISLDNSLIYATRQWVDAYYVPRADIVDNLTTDESKKPVSAKQGKALQDNKLDKDANAVSASKLKTARKIQGTDFDGSEDITLRNATADLAGVVKLVNDLTTGGTDKALSAAQGKLLNDQAFGIGQTWQNMTASRSNNTTYTNSTKKPIQVWAVIRDTNGSGLSISIGSTTITLTQDLAANGFYSFPFVVPPDTSYKLYWAGGANTELSFWLELRT